MAGKGGGKGKVVVCDVHEHPLHCDVGRRRVDAEREFTQVRIAHLTRGSRGGGE